MKKIYLLLGIFLLLTLALLTIFLVTAAKRVKQAVKPSIPPPIMAPVPEPSGEDLIRNFFYLINKGEADKTLGMLSAVMSPDEAAKQDWQANFNSIQTVTITTIEPWDKANWQPDKEVYKVVLDLTLKSGDFSYGWYNGENTRWIDVDKKPTSLWQINSINSGP